jgi:hypothetical protein
LLFVALVVVAVAASPVTPMITCVPSVSAALFVVIAVR